MRYVSSFLQFWRKFLIGDDWRVAASVAACLAMVCVLAAMHINAWLILPLTLFATLALTLWPHTVGTRNRIGNRFLAAYGDWLVVWVPMAVLGATLFVEVYFTIQLTRPGHDISLAILYSITLTYLGIVTITPQTARSKFTSYFAGVLMAFLFLNPANALYILSDAVAVVLAFRTGRWYLRMMRTRNRMNDELLRGILLTAIGIIFLVQFLMPVSSLPAGNPPPASQTIDPDGM